VQAWALNRYYYQSTIPLKDAMVISRFRDRTTRVEWRHRIEDHDWRLGSEGGIERWLKLTEGLGLDSAYVESTEGILARDAALRSRPTCISAATRRRLRRSPLR
jgi:pyrroloquinoline-quinone synthase